MSQTTDKRKKILILAANPVDMGSVDLMGEMDAIREAIPDHESKFEIDYALETTAESLTTKLIQVKPKIVHFCGHGVIDGIYLEGDQRRAEKVSEKQLSALFDAASDFVECVLLNACLTSTVAEPIGQHIQYVISMEGRITNEAAIQFASIFYTSVARNGTYEEAFEFGRTKLIPLPGQPDRILRMLRQKDEPTVFRIRDLSESLKAKCPASSAHVCELLDELEVLLDTKRFHEAAQRVRPFLMTLKGLYDRLRKTRIILDLPLVVKPDQLIVTLGKQSNVSSEPVDAAYESIIRFDRGLSRTRAEPINDGYRVFEFATNVLEVIEWIFNAYGENLEAKEDILPREQSFRTRRRRAVSEELNHPTNASVGPLYAAAFAAFEKRDQESLERAKSLCEDIAKLADDVDEMIAPLLAQIEFRREVFALGDACRELDLNNCDKLALELKQRLESESAFDACAADDREEFGCLEKLASALSQMGGAIHLLLADREYAAARDQFELACDILMPLTLDSLDEWEDFVQMVIGAARHLSGVSSCLEDLMEYKSDRRLARSLGDYDPADDPEENVDRYRSIYARLAAARQANLRLHELFDGPEDHVLEGIELLKRGVDIPGDLEHLVPRIDGGELDSILTDVRGRIYRAELHHRFYQCLEADDLETAADIAKQGSIPDSENWVKYLTGVTTWKSQLSMLKTVVLESGERDANRQNWSEFVKEAETLREQTCELESFWEQRIKNRSQSLGEGSYLDFDDIKKVGRTIEDYAQVLSQLQSMEEALKEADLERARILCDGLESGDTTDSVDLARYREFIREAQTFSDALSELERELDKVSRNDAMRRIRGLRISAANPASRHLEPRRTQLLQRMVAEQISQIEGIREILANHRQDGCMRDLTVTERPDLPAGYGALFHLRMDDLDAFDGWLERLADPDELEGAADMDVVDGLGRDKRDTALLISALGSHDRAIHLMEDLVRKNCNLANLHTLGVFYLTAYASADDEDERIQHLGNAVEYLLPLLLQRDCSAIAEIVPSNDGWNQVGMRAAALKHLSLIVHETGDEALTTRFDRERATVEAMAKLNRLCRGNFGFLELRDGSRLSVGCSLITKHGDWSQVTSELSRMENARPIVESPKNQATLRGLLWRLRLLLCEETFPALLAFDDNRLPMTLASVESVLDRLPGRIETIEPNPESGYRRMLDLSRDVKRLKGLVLHQHCRAVLAAESDEFALQSAVRAILAPLRQCVIVAKEVGELGDLVMPISRQIRSMANKVPRTADLRSRYYTAIGMIEYTVFLQRELTEDERAFAGLELDYLVEYATDLSQQIFRSQMSQLYRDVSVDREQFEATMQIHEKLLRGLDAIAPRTPQTLYDFGILALMRILVLKPGEKIANILSRCHVELQQLEQRATLLGLNKVASSVERMCHEIESVMHSGDLPSIRGRLLKIFKHE